MGEQPVRNCRLSMRNHGLILDGIPHELPQQPAALLRLLVSTPSDMLIGPDECQVATIEVPHVRISDASGLERNVQACRLGA